jgi:transposase-like protein
MPPAGPASPTLRCPRCGNSDLHFYAEGDVQCSRCRRRFSREELARTDGTAGHSYDNDAKGKE